MDRDRSNKVSINAAILPIVKRADIRRASMNSHQDGIIGITSASDNIVDKVSKLNSGPINLEYYKPQHRVNNNNKEQQQLILKNEKH